MRDDPFEGLLAATPSRPRPIPFPGARPPGRTREPTGLNGDLLRRDVGLLALPYGHGPDDGFRLTLTPAEAKTQELVAQALPAQGYRWNLSDAFRDYLRTALWYLVDGDIYLEITYFHQPEALTGPPVAFRVDFLQPEMITRRIVRYHHFVPLDEDGEPTRWGSTPIDGRRLVVGSLPRSLRRELDRTLKLLRAADEDLSVMSAFTMGEHASASGFDFTTYQRELHDIVLAGSREIGWAGRGTFTSDLLDPEKAWRAIQFARFITRLREIALATLQVAVDRAGAEIGFSAELTLSGVLTLDDLDTYETDLKAGTRPISELLFPKASPSE